MLTDFLADLRRLGVQVWAENGQLRYRAPARTLTDDLRSELAKHKADLLALFHDDNEPRSVLEYIPLPVLTPDPENRHEPFPLTDIQHAYWIGRGGSFELGNVATHAYLEFEGEGVDVERLSGAWAQVIGRHDMLRAVVRADGQQEILATVPPYAIGVSEAATTTGEMSGSRLDAPIRAATRCVGWIKPGGY